MLIFEFFTFVLSRRFLLQITSQCIWIQVLTYWLFDTRVSFGTVQVLGDGAQLWTSQPLRKLPSVGPVRPGFESHTYELADVDVTGVLSLTLRVVATGVPAVVLCVVVVGVPKLVVVAALVTVALQHALAVVLRVVTTGVPAVVLCEVVVGVPKLVVVGAVVPGAP